MSNPIPNQLALTTIADGSAQQAAPVRNNYSAIQSAFNELVAALSGGSAGQVLEAVDSTHVQWGTSSPGLYRKTTVKQVVNTVAETDLLNGEITIAGNTLATSGVARLTMWGDYIQNSGGAQAMPRFKVKLGAGPTTVLDTTSLGAGVSANNANRFFWRAQVEIMNLGATNVQIVVVDLNIGVSNVSAAAASFFATGEGAYDFSGSAGSITTARAKGITTAAIDTTAAMAVQFSVINPVASATMDTKLLGAILEVL